MAYIISAIHRDGFRSFVESWRGHWHYDINLALRLEYQGVAESKAQDLSNDSMVMSTYVLENEGHRVVARYEKGQPAKFMDGLHWEDLN